MFPVLSYYIEQKKFVWYHINREKNKTLVGKKIISKYFSISFVRRIRVFEEIKVCFYIAKSVKKIL